MGKSIAGDAPQSGSRKNGEVGNRPALNVENYVSQMPAGVATHEIICDETGAPCDYRFLDVNPAFERLLGVSAESVVGRTVLEIFPETEDCWIQTWGEVAISGQSAHLESYSESTQRHYDAHGFSIGNRQFVVVFTDVTERKNAESEISRAAVEKQVILDSLAEHVVYQDNEMGVIWANRAAADAVQQSPEELAGRKCYSIWPRRNEACTDCPVSLARDTCTEQAAEVVTPDGRVWWVRGVPVQSNGEILGMVEVTREITEFKKTEYQIREGEQRYRSLFEAAGDAIFTVRLAESGPIIADCNRRATEMFGWHHDEMIGMSPMVLSPQLQPDGTSSAEAIMRNVNTVLSGTPVQVDWLHERKDGSRFDAEVTLSRVTLDQENCIQGIIRDLSRRRRAEEELRRSERMLAAAQVAAHVGSWELEVATDNITWSEELVRILGLDNRDFEPSLEALSRVVHPDDRERFFDAIDRMGSGQEQLHSDLRVVHADGQARWVHLHGHRVLGDDDQPVRFVGTAQDVTDRRIAELALRDSEERHRSLFETMAHGVVYQDADGNITSANPAAERILGLSVSQMQGLTSMDPAWKAIHQDGSDFPGETHPAMVALRTGQAVRDVVMGVYHPRTKEYRWININAVPQFRSNEDRPSEVYTTFEDTTDRRRAEEELRKSERLLADAQEAGNVGSWERDLRTDKVHWSDEMFRILGYSPQEFQPASDKFIQCIHEDDLDRYKQAKEAVRRGSESVDVEVRAIRKNGTQANLQVRGTVTLDEFGRGIRAVGTLQDITGLKHAEAQLRLNERKYRTLFEAAGDALFTLERTDDGGHFTDCNAKATSMFGWDREELIGMSPVDISPPNQPDGRPSSEAAWNYVSAALAGEYQHFEWLHMRKDGSLFHAEVILNSTTSGDEFLVQASVRDVSERVEAEQQRRKLEAGLQEAQRIESLSVLAGGVAHDFNNLLTGVLGNAELALADLSPVSPARREVERIRSAALRAAELSRQMLAYSGKGQFVLDAVDLSEVISEIKHLMASSVNKSASLEFQLTEPMPAIEADVTQIRQTVMALLVNASEALGENGGTIKIASGVDVCEKKYLSELQGGQDCVGGRYAYFEVEDAGGGMDNETLSRMFDPFFTTKFAGRGLGLAAVLGIVRGHAGAIDVQSSLGRGTRIRVLFPVTTKPQRKFRKTPPGRHERLIGKSILIVDDEPAVLDVGRVMLEKAGVIVFTAAGGPEAETVFEDHGREIDCVLLDLTMPGMSGEETLTHLRRIRQDVPVVLSSGYTRHEVETEFGSRGFAGFLQKPYKLDQLLRTLGDALEG